MKNKNTVFFLILEIILWPLRFRSGPTAAGATHSVALRVKTTVTVGVFLKATCILLRGVFA